MTTQNFSNISTICIESKMATYDEESNQKHEIDFLFSKHTLHVRPYWP